MSSRLPRIALRAALCLAATLVRPASAQDTRFTSEPVRMGPGGFALDFDVLWTCDDDPRGTTSAPGRVDLVDGAGNLVGQVAVTAARGTPQASVTGAGTVSNLTASINLLGAGGTPADGIAHATWTVPDLGPGPYTFRLWFSQSSVRGNPLSTVSTQVLVAGGGPLGGTQAPPSVTLSAPGSATVFQRVTVAAAASAAPGGSPLASVAIDVSLDNGATWARIDANPRPSSPADSESVSYALAAVGSATLRATATDAAGLVGTSQATIAVGKADQPAVAITPASATVAAGASIVFSASGGATGNYTFGGAASGQGPVQRVAFPAPGAYRVTVFDSGNADYNPSPAASASVAVQVPFYTLSVSASAGGSVSGGGNYPPGALAAAAASADPGNAFAGWTGDATGPSPTLLVLMDANKSVLAHFTPLLAQTISFAAPRSVTTRTPPFALAASASSGLPVTLALDSGPATLTGAVLAPSGSAGEVTVTATQPGNAVYLPAQPVVVSFAIGPPPPGVLLTDDSAATRRSDKVTRTTSFRCGPPD